MSLFPEQDSSAIYFSMDDPNEPMARNSPHPFRLDEQNWLTVEHYYQTMKFEGSEYQKTILDATSAEQAKTLGKVRFKKKRKDFKQVKNTLMIRAVYIQAKTHPLIAKRILETGQVKLVENSQFDYYWGCGRDHRGDNHYGKTLMQVRDKLYQEQSNQT